MPGWFKSRYLLYVAVGVTLIIVRQIVYAF